MWGSACLAFKSGLSGETQNQMKTTTANVKPLRKPLSKRLNLIYCLSLIERTKAIDVVNACANSFHVG